ncbi:hypothetical protein HG548_18760 [Citrobacter sp. DNRA3]|uniref:LuxR C-terminal-related transcriptional regulator n=1 Tax=Citrobacter sp. DNRA3 TaxID=2723054 RepID=UPI001459E523|nr:LuxR C-terminal-related transcriptional regulator [Citrobacter sp. DNRA3]NBJ29679.1 hypothetical protein [Citrobacter freundii]NMD76568.1 hypothetical protein [Citrobacter sp. DNRA3]
MHNLNIYSENVYASKTIQFLLEKHRVNSHSKHSISIFMFFRDWIRDEDFTALLQATTDIILIIAPVSVLSFVQKNINREKIEYLSCIATLDEIEKKMSSFLVLPQRIFCKKTHHIEVTPSLTETEINVISLYLSGMKFSFIGEILDLKSILVKKHKVNAMNKMGLINDQSLIRHWHLLVRRRERQSQKPARQSLAC